LTPPSSAPFGDGDEAGEGDWLFWGGGAGGESRWEGAGDGDWGEPEGELWEEGAIWGEWECGGEEGEISGGGAGAGDSAVEAMLTKKERRRRRAENAAGAGFAIEGIEYGLKNVGSDIESVKVFERSRNCFETGTGNWVVDLESVRTENDELGFIR